MSDKLRISALVLLLAWTLLPRLWLATINPNQTAAWDERYNVRNVAWLLENGPASIDNASYPGLSFVPHTLTLAGVGALKDLLTGEPSGWIVRQGGPRMARAGRADGLDLSAAGYTTARLVNVAFAAISVLACVALAARIVGPTWALLAGGLLASVPWHLRQSATFKPDIVLVASLAIAVLCAVRAAERGKLADFALAGAAVGLALSSKYNAVAVTIPFLFAAFLVPGTRAVDLARRCLIGGAAAIGVFVACNPWVLSEPSLYVTDFRATLRHYERASRWAEVSHVAVLASSARWLADGIYHGVAVSLLGAVGLVGAGVSALRRREEPRNVAAILTVVFVVGYSLVYSAATRHVDAFHNWLALSPFVAALAALPLRQVGALLAARRPVLGWLAPLAGLVVLAVGATDAWAFTYAQAVPPLSRKVSAYLQKQLGNPRGRVIASEVGLEDLVERPRSATVLRSPSLAELASDRLELVDAEVYRADEVPPDVRRRAERLAGAAMTFEPRWFKVRGDRLLLLMHGGRRLDDGLSLDLLRTPDREAVFVGALQTLPADAHSVSFQLWLPRGVAAVVHIGERSVETVPIRASGESYFAGTERIPIAGDRNPLVTLTLAGKLERPPDRLEATAFAWRSPRRTARID